MAVNQLEGTTDISIYCLFFTAEICVVEVIDEVLNETLSVPASLLFVLDESGSVGQQNFVRSKEFIKHIVDKYP